jgi:hypothetical protein
MPSQNQQGDSQDYKSDAHRILSEWDTRMLLQLEPMQVSTAKELLGAANELEASLEVKEHLAECIRKRK